MTKRNIMPAMMAGFILTVFAAAPQPARAAPAPTVAEVPAAR